MKIGVSVRIDVTKITKDKLYVGAKGTYLDCTTFIDTDELDQYGNNGFIAESVSKEEREAGTKGPILGNVKVFYNDSTGVTHPNTPQPQQGQQNTPNVNKDLPQGATDFDDSEEIPF